MRDATLLLRLSDAKCLLRQAIAAVFSACMRSSQLRSDLGWSWCAGRTDGPPSRLLFKKRMFRETDEAISEPIFVSLSFVQAQHDYLQARLPPPDTLPS